MVIAISAIEVETVYPPRAIVSVTGITAGDMIRVHRLVGGTMTPIRGGYVEDADTDTLVITDGEAPFGVPVQWRVRRNENSPSFTDTDSNTITLDLPVNSARGKQEDVLSDAITGLSAEVVIAAWDRKSYQADSTIYRVGGKNRVVSGVSQVGQFQADIRFVTFSYTSEQNLMQLLANATTSIIQYRRSVSDGKTSDCYLTVTDFEVQRFSQDLDDERRYFVLSVFETDAWAPAFEARGFTYDDLETVYTGQTYADLELDYGTYLALAQADLSS